MIDRSLVGASTQVGGACDLADSTATALPRRIRGGVRHTPSRYLLLAGIERLAPSNRNGMSERDVTVNAMQDPLCGIRFGVTVRSNSPE